MAHRLHELVSLLMVALALAWVCSSCGQVRPATPDELEATHASALDHAEDCAASELNDVSGPVEVRLGINTNGEVETTEVMTEAARQPAFKSCLERANSQLSFGGLETETYHDFTVFVVDCPRSTSRLRIARDDWQILRCVTSNGIPHGPEVSWSGLDTLRRTGTYLYGLRNGSWSLFAKDGAPIWSGTVRYGTKHGRWLEWDEEGMQPDDCTWKDGRKIDCVNREVTLEPFQQIGCIKPGVRNCFKGRRSSPQTEPLSTREIPWPSTETYYETGAGFRDGILWSRVDLHTSSGCIFVQSATDESGHGRLRLQSGCEVGGPEKTLREAAPDELLVLLDATHFDGKFNVFYLLNDQMMVRSIELDGGTVNVGKPRNLLEDFDTDHYDLIRLADLVEWVSAERSISLVERALGAARRAGEDTKHLERMLAVDKPLVLLARVAEGEPLDLTRLSPMVIEGLLYTTRDLDLELELAKQVVELHPNSVEFRNAIANGLRSSAPCVSQTHREWLVKRAKTAYSRIVHEQALVESSCRCAKKNAGEDAKAQKRACDTRKMARVIGINADLGTESDGAATLDLHSSSGDDLVARLRFYDTEGYALGPGRDIGVVTGANFPHFPIAPSTLSIGPSGEPVLAVYYEGAFYAVSPEDGLLGNDQHELEPAKALLLDAADMLHRVHNAELVADLLEQASDLEPTDLELKIRFAMQTRRTKDVCRGYNALKVALAGGYEPPEPEKFAEIVKSYHRQCRKATTEL